MSESLIKEFDRLISSGSLDIRMSRNMDPRDLSYEDKIKFMEALNTMDRTEEE